MMNPAQLQQQQQQLQQQQVSPPPGVENIYVIPRYYGRPQVLMTLDMNARHKLKIYSVIMLVCGPLFVLLTTACILVDQPYLTQGYFAGILATVTGIVGLYASKTNNACAIRAVNILAIMSMVFGITVTFIVVFINGILDEIQSAEVIALMAFLTLIGVIVGILSLMATVFFCRITCYATNHYAAVMMYPPAQGQQPVMMYYGQQPLMYGQQQQVFGPPAGQPDYNMAHQNPPSNPAEYQQMLQLQQYPSSSLPPSYDTVVNVKD